jgi:serine/threonine-protein kinase
VSTRFGRYELLRKIAAGGMAEVFLARQWGEGGFFRDVVIKRLFRHLAEHPRALKMFQYEARLLAELSHPNIPQVFELGYEDSTWYLAMELVDGHTVADVWRAGARAGNVMPMAVAAGVVLQAAEALHHAHERRDRGGNPLRIVHRDVTPHNAMLTRDGVAKVMDFGVAQTAARRDTESGAVKGTFSYMAPEQVRARPLDKRADVFALGVILYELTTGTRLYRGTDVQVMTAIVEQDAPPPSARVPGYPLDLEEIVMAALARDRQQRIPSAGHLALALEEFAVRHGLVIGVRAVGRYVQSVFPYEREREDELAMVSDDVDVADVPNRPDMQGTDPELLGQDLDDPDLLADLDLLDPERRPSAEQTPVAHLIPGQYPQTLPPEALEDLLFEDITDDEGKRPAAQPPPIESFDDDRARPVVLLDSPKRQAAPDGDFVEDLARRLEGDED